MKLTLVGITVKAARVLVGMRGHRPSAFNACVGGALRGKRYIPPATGMGGRNNKEVHRAFVEAAKSCGAHIAKARF